MSLILFSGCVSNHFVPHAHNVPLFTEKKQTLTNLDVSISAADVQVAHSFSNHFAGILNYKAQAQAPICLELGGGYFNSPTKWMVSELYGGVGIGNYQQTGNAPRDFKFYFNTKFDSKTDIKSYQAFLQPNLGFRPRKNIVLGLSLKANYWYYPSYHYELQKTTSPLLGGKGKTEELVHISEKNITTLTLEPAFTFRLEGEGAKFTLQAGTYSTYIDPAVSPYDNLYFFMRIGLNWVLK